MGILFIILAAVFFIIMSAASLPDCEERTRFCYEQEPEQKRTEKKIPVERISRGETRSAA